MRMATGFYAIDAIDDVRSLVHYEVDVDPGGRLPRWLVSMESRKNPLETLTGLRKRLEQTRGQYAAEIALFPDAASRSRSQRSEAGVVKAETELKGVLMSLDEDEHRDLKAVVVLIGGKIASERYYNGSNETALHDVRSAGKSITSLLVGIAIDDGHMKSVGDPLQRYLPMAVDRPAGAIGLKDLLTMRSGLDADDQQADSPGNEDRLDAAPDPVAFAMRLGLREPPGTQYVYNSVTAYIVGLAVEGAVGESLEAFATGKLFAPLAITKWRWRKDRAGHTTGQSSLWLTARDFAKIGQLVMNEGIWNGQRVVGAKWIRESLTPWVRISEVDPFADGYGYFWYSKSHQIGERDLRVHFASGNEGNKIYVVPARSMIIAIQSSAYGRRYGQRRSEQTMSGYRVKTIRMR